MIDVRIFTRDGLEKDKRAKDIEQQELARVRKNIEAEYAIVENATYERLASALSGKVAMLDRS